MNKLPSWLAILALVGAGCRSAPPPAPSAAPAPIAWLTDLALALDDARRTGKPILVVAVIGDIEHQC